jgi:uncharacterized protein (TIGR04222 family)
MSVGSITFWVLYAAASSWWFAVVVSAGRRNGSFDATRRVNLISVAYLAGRWPRTLDTALAALVRSGNLSVNSADVLTVLRGQAADPAEQVILDEISRLGGRVQRLELRYRLWRFERVVQAAEARLQSFGMMYSPRHRSVARVSGLVWAVLGIVGATRVAAQSAGRLAHPVAAILIFSALGAALHGILPSRHTWHGRTLLRKLQTEMRRGAIEAEFDADLMHTALFGTDTMWDAIYHGDRPAIPAAPAIPAIASDLAGWGAVLSQFRRSRFGPEAAQAGPGTPAADCAEDDDMSGMALGVVYVSDDGILGGVEDGGQVRADGDSPAGSVGG